MLDLDLSEQIRALRSTFADIRAVVDVERLTAEISRLSELAEALISGMTLRTLRRSRVN